MMTPASLTNDSSQAQSQSICMLAPAKRAAGIAMSDALLHRNLCNLWRPPAVTGNDHVGHDASMANEQLNFELNFESFDRNLVVRRRRRRREEARAIDKGARSLAGSHSSAGDGDAQQQSYRIK